MRLSQLFFQTQRQTPAEAETPGYQYLLRAGFISPTASGIYSALPLAARVFRQIKKHLHADLCRQGAQEINLPPVQPADFWQKSGRWFNPVQSGLHFKDSRQRDLVLSGSHIEVLADVLRQVLRSHKQLPLLLYQFQPDWQVDKESFPHAGLLRSRLSETLSVYAVARDENAGGALNQTLLDWLKTLFERWSLPLTAIQAQPSDPVVYVYTTPWGDESFIRCPECTYLCNQKQAKFKKTPAAPQSPLPLQEVFTPGMKTINDLAEFLNVKTAQTAKAVFLVAGMPAPAGAVENRTPPERFIFAVVRGDMDVNESKLIQAIGALTLRPAREEEIIATGAVPGYASPVGLKNVWVIVDEAVTNSPNLVAGANREGYHLLNVNYGRDYLANQVADIALASQANACPHCGAHLTLEYGIELASLNTLGTRYSDLFEVVFQDENGTANPAWMSVLTLNLDRLLGCLAETHHDDFGLIWPAAAAPYQVHLVALNGAEEAAEALYLSLAKAGLEVLFDDRSESPGVKFNDADLIGIPIRLTLGKRTLKENAVELKLRHRSNSDLIPLSQVESCIQSLIKQLQTKQTPTASETAA
ncbi:MAG: proline--tRNA ligase [Anaerolineae bacterium]|nr:proline--tRNA ligase [Anaerolineae bacterium]